MYKINYAHIRRASLIGLPLLLIGILIGYSFTGNEDSANHAVYVDSIQLYESFDLKNELQLKLESLSNNRTVMLDSLRIQVEQLGRQLNMLPEPTAEQIGYFNQLREGYFEKEQLFAGEIDRVAQTYDQQIWTQMNQYVKEFGEANGIDFIYGANGDGSLMYASSEHDITDQALEFINQRYNSISTK